MKCGINAQVSKENMALHLELHLWSKLVYVSILNAIAEVESSGSAWRR